MNTGAFGENFPYSNFHDLNMDWIIKIAKDFLDQYTNIQETISNGLVALEDKKTTLEQELQTWYDTHSQDIANQLNTSLNELNEWYSTHYRFLEEYLEYATNQFNSRANTKADQVIASIPSDYTTLSNTVNYNSDGVFIIPSGDFEEGTLSNGTLVAMSYRVCTPNIHFYDHAIRFSIKQGFMFAIHLFNYNDTFAISTPWITSDYILPAGRKFKVVIRRVEENTSESASTTAFASQLYLTTALGTAVMNNSIDYGIMRLPYNNFVQGTLSEGNVISRANRVCTPDIHSFDYPITFNIADGFTYNLNLFNDSDVYTSSTNWLTGEYTIPANQKFKVVIRRVTENNNEAAYEPEYAYLLTLSSYLGSMVKNLENSYNNQYLYTNFEIGGLNTVGNPVTRDFAIRSIDYIDTNYFNKFNIAQGYTITVCYYDRTTKEFVSLNEIAIAGEYAFTPNSLCKITFRLTENYVPIASPNELSPFILIYPSVLNNAKYVKYSWNAVGDSLTYGDYYVDQVESDLLFRAFTKYGVEGSTIAKNMTSENDIISTFGDRYTRPTSIVERLPNIPTADVFTVFGGTNDWYYDTPLGSIAPIGSTFDITTFYGALQSICENIQNRENSPYFLLITPTKANRSRFSTGSITYEQIVKAFKDVGELYSVPVLDLYNNSGISIINLSRTTIDNLHPSTVGINMIVPQIITALKNILK